MLSVTCGHRLRRNVGEGKDSEPRQRAAIAGYAEKAGYLIAEDDWYYDAAVRGADSIEARDGFIAMLARIQSNGVRNDHCRDGEPVCPRSDGAGGGFKMFEEGGDHVDRR